MASPKTRAPKTEAKTSPVNPKDTVMLTEANTLPAPSAPLVADNATPNGAPTTDAANDAGDLTNVIPDVKTGPAPETAFNLIAYMLGWPGGAPAREGGFPSLLARALDVNLGRADLTAKRRAAEVNAILRAAYKSAQPVRIETEAGPYALTSEEVRVFCTLVSYLSDDAKSGKAARALTGVGRRLAAAEKAVKRAVKSTGMTRGEVETEGRSIAGAILGIDDSADSRRAYLRAYKA